MSKKLVGIIAITGIAALVLVLLNRPTQRRRRPTGQPTGGSGTPTGGGTGTPTGQPTGGSGTPTGGGTGTPTGGGTGGGGVRPPIQQPRPKTPTRLPMPRKPIDAIIGGGGGGYSPRIPGDYSGIFDGGLADYSEGDYNNDDGYLPNAYGPQDLQTEFF
jgi:hypothetical protein